MSLNSIRLRPGAFDLDKTFLFIFNQGKKIHDKIIRINSAMMNVATGFTAAIKATLNKFPKLHKESRAFGRN